MGGVILIFSILDVHSFISGIQLFDIECEDMNEKYCLYEYRINISLSPIYHVYITSDLCYQNTLSNGYSIIKQYSFANNNCNQLLKNNKIKSFLGLIGKVLHVVVVNNFYLHYFNKRKRICYRCWHIPSCIHYASAQIVSQDKDLLFVAMLLCMCLFCYVFCQVTYYLQ